MRWLRLIHIPVALALILFCELWSNHHKLGSSRSVIDLATTESPRRRRRNYRNLTLSQIQGTYLLSIHVAYCEKYKFLTCAPAKSGSSEVLRWVSRVCLGLMDVKSPYSDPRMPLVSLMDNKSMLESMFQSWTIVTFVRDPWIRLVSGYRDKLSDPQPKNGTWACDIIAQVRGRPCGDNERGLTLEDVVKYVVQTPDDNSRFEHFSSQESACPIWLEPDFVVHHERFVEDLKIASRALGLDTSLIDPPTTFQSAETALDFFGNSSCDLAEKVRQRFLVDVKRFGFKGPPCHPE